jgi:hypothetical protein
MASFFLSPAEGIYQVQCLADVVYRGKRHGQDAYRVLVLCYALIGHAPEQVGHAPDKDQVSGAVF